MYSLMYLTLVPKVAVVEGIGEYVRNSVSVEALAVAGYDPALRQKVSDVLEATVVLSVELEGFFDNRSFIAVNYNTSGAWIIEVAGWSQPWVLSSSDFLAQSPFSVLGKRIHVVFALPKGDTEHEFTLARVICTEHGKLESLEIPAVQEVD